MNLPQASPRRQRGFWAVLAAAIAAGLALDLATGLTPLLTAALGFGGAVLLVEVSKWLGARLLHRPESYYGEEP